MRRNNYSESKAVEIDWFADIDGVMNVFPKGPDPKNRGPHLRQWKHWTQTTIDNYPILYSPDLIQRMNKVAETVDITMLTTWYETSVSFFNPGVGLNSSQFAPRKVGLNFPIVCSKPNPNKEAEWWKLNVIKEHMDTKGTPFIWTDDQIMNFIRRHVEAIAREKGIPCLLISPYETMGLEKKHMDQIDAFVAAHS